MSGEDANLPAKGGSYEATRFNALKHGVLARHAVLPWEDEAEYAALLDAFLAEHAPEGPTERHLVEELAGIVWRKRRLRQAEAAVHQAALKDTTSPFSETAQAALVHVGFSRQDESPGRAVRTPPEVTAWQEEQVAAEAASIAEAQRILAAGGADAYACAVAALADEPRAAWEEALAADVEELEEGEEPYAATADDLAAFLGDRRVDCAKRRSALARRGLIREQAFGEALDPRRLVPLARYEAHLDRKLERTLAMLLRLKELRGPG